MVPTNIRSGRQSPPWHIIIPTLAGNEQAAHRELECSFQKQQLSTVIELQTKGADHFMVTSSERDVAKVWFVRGFFFVVCLSFQTSKQET